jgi:hypothetical protein
MCSRFTGNENFKVLLLRDLPQQGDPYSIELSQSVAHERIRLKLKE